MLPRATWKGYLRLGKVSCAIAMFSASTHTDRISFRQINPRTGNPCRQQLVDEVTGEVVDREHVGRGYEIAPGVIVEVTDDEIDTLKIESTSALVIEKFVAAGSIDQVFRDGPFYVVPDDRVADEAFSVIREAMSLERVDALARVVLSGRERLMCLSSRDLGMFASTLRYPYEVRPDRDILATVGAEVPPDALVKAARRIMSRKKGSFKPDRYIDRYEAALIDLLKAKYAKGEHKGRPVGHGEDGTLGLMDALKQSLGSKSKKRS